MTDRPHVILICADQWRGDCLGAAGHPIVATPHLDALAREGARFARAYAATPTCIPARAALYAGLTQGSHGRVGYQDGVPWDYPVTLGTEFGRHGYQTEAIGKLHVYPERTRLGFDHVVLHDGFLRASRRRDRGGELLDDYLPWLRAQLGRDADYFDTGINANSTVARPWDKPEHLHPTNWVVTQAIDFLRRRDPRSPFLLFLSFVRPHPPYDPPAWAFEQYHDLDEPMPEPPVGDWVDVFGEWATPGLHNGHVGPIDGRALRRARAGYFGHITHIDLQINRFLETLADFGLLEESVVCFLSDHGEMMGDHRLFRKGYPYEGSSRVPLLLKGPAGSGIRPGLVVEEVVELRDVLPTLLESAGLPAAESVEGRSALPLARGESVPWRSYLHGEHVLFGQSLQWLTDGHEKYVWFGGSGREQLFDLDADPTELHDLAGDPAAEPRLARWRRALAAELAGREGGASDGERLIPGRPAAALLAPLAGGPSVR